MLHKLFMSKVDFTSAFLQTGPDDRDVFVRPPRSDPSRFTLRRLNVAAYGLVDANAKWQSKSDELLLDCGLSQLILLPQILLLPELRKALAYRHKTRKRPHDWQHDENRAHQIHQLKKKFEVGTVIHTTHTLRNWDLNFKLRFAISYKKIDNNSKDVYTFAC